jgi:hypothetical protein
VQTVVTLRSRKRVDNQVVDPKVDHAEPKANLVEKEGQEGKEGDNNKKEGDVEPSTITLVVKEPPRSFVLKVPYPERLQTPKKGGKKEDILEVFKQVQINIPFLDAI